MNDDLELRCRRCHVVMTHHCSAPELAAAVRALVAFRPEGGMPDAVVRAAKRGGWYSKGDEDAPFFTETFLYELFLWKDPARGLLRLIRNVAEAAGVDIDEVQE